MGLLLSATAPISALAAEGCIGPSEIALDWLKRMSLSSHEVNYQGVVALRRGNDTQVVHVTHSIDGGSSSDKLTQLTGQGASVERFAHPLECLHPGPQLLRIDTLGEPAACGLEAQYRFSVVDSSPIAGRETVRIEIEPRDMYRFGYVLELDQETALLLGSATVARGKTVLERFQFTRLSYGEDAVNPGVADVTHRAQHPHPDHPVDSGVANRHWAIGWLPDGFTLTDSPDSNGPRRTYTDGLAVFSVFLEELNRELRAGEGMVRTGGTLSYTRGMSLDGQPILATIIGEVPVNTARMVADSIAWTR